MEQRSTSGAAQHQWSSAAPVEQRSTSGPAQHRAASAGREHNSTVVEIKILQPGQEGELMQEVNKTIGQIVVLLILNVENIMKELRI